jgi:hypothetical protein
MKGRRRIWRAVSGLVLAVILGGFWLQRSRKQPDIRPGLTQEEVDRMLDGETLLCEGNLSSTVCLYVFQDWSGGRHRWLVTFDHEGKVRDFEARDDPPPPILDRVRHILRLD